MLRRSLWSVVVLSGFLAGVLALSACQGNEVKRNLGLEQEAPDEFMVLRNRSLTVPPDLTVLPDPKAGALYTESTIPAQAKSQLIEGSKEKSRKNLSGGESKLLKRAGADNADPNIKTTIAKERELTLKQKEVLAKEEEDSGLFGLGTLVSPLKPAPQDPIVDPKKEKERIAKNKEEGRDITEGETPEIKRSGNVLDEIF